MKKNVFSLGLMAVAALTLAVNCTKSEIEQQDETPAVQEEVKGTPFEIVVKSIETKTTNDGMSTEWKAEDGINLFHREHGTTGSYGTNDQFTITSAKLEDEVFTGTLTEALADGKTYDWWALYPYNASISTPANTTYSSSIGSTSKTQAGYNSTAHLAGTTLPLVGKAEDVAKASTPSIAMNHVASLVKIIVTNKNDDPLTITSVSLTAPENIVGSFIIDFSDPDNLSFTDGAYTKSSTAELKVTGGTALAKNETATFYIPVKPFALSISDELSIKVNTYTKTLTMTKAVTFVSGGVKTINFAYDKTFTSQNFYLASSIAAGDKVIFTNSTGATPYVMGHYSSGNNVPYVSGTNTSGRIASTSSMGVYTVAYDADKGYTFYDSETETYLNATNTTSSNYLKGIADLDDYAYWTVSISGAATITNKGKSSRNVIKYNSSSNFFSAYNSDYTTNVDPVYIYKYDDRTPLTTYSFGSASVTKTPEEATSYTGLTVTSSPSVTSTYAMTGDAIGTINASTGALSLDGTEGTAVVTASFAGDVTYAPATASYTVIVKGKNIILTASTTNMPSGYGTANTFTEYTLEGYKFKIQQIYKNSGKLQMRASGNSNGTGTIYNTDTFPGNIKTITITYDSSDSNKNCTLSIGSSENPTSGTSITPSSSGLVYTFDCSSYSFDYFVLANGEYAGYLDSIKIEWK